MNNLNLTTVKKQIIFEEGRRNLRYKCSAGHWTIGVGHNMDAEPTFEGKPIPNFIDDAFIDRLFLHDMNQLIEELRVKLPRLFELDPARRDAFINMAFQMGVGSRKDGTGLLGFERTLAAAFARDWKTAHEQALKSKWARADTPARAIRVAGQILTGKYYEIPERRSHD